MQNWILLAVVVLLAAVLIVFLVLNHLRDKRFVREKNRSNVDEIFSDYFSHVDRSVFIKTWGDLAKTLGVPIDKLALDDKVSDFIENRHLPELYVDNMELYFQDKGIALSEIDVNTTIREILVKLFEKNR